MGIFGYFRSKKESPASIAKERLQIIVAHERSQRAQSPDYLPQLQQDILEVISRYVEINKDQVSVSLDSEADGCSILELNVTLPENEKLN